MRSLPAVFEMATGYWASQVVYVAAKLGVADLLADCPKSYEQIVDATGADRGCVFRLMRALAGLAARGETGHFHAAAEII